MSFSNQEDLESGVYYAPQFTGTRKINRGGKFKVTGFERVVADKVTHSIEYYKGVRTYNRFDSNQRRIK